MRAAAAFIAAIMLAAAAAARADTPALSVADITALAHALGVWDDADIARLFGPATRAVVPEGDHYIVTTPAFAGQQSTGWSGGDVVRRGRPLGQGRWRFDALTLPKSVRFGPADDPTSIAITASHVAERATLDPSDVTESTDDVILGNARAHVTHDKPAVGHASRDVDLTIRAGAVERYLADAASDMGRVDGVDRLSVADLQVDGVAPILPPVRLRRFDITETYDGVSRRDVRALTTLLMVLMRPRPAPVVSDAVVVTSKPDYARFGPDPQKALHDVVRLASQSLVSYDVTARADDMRVGDASLASFSVDLGLAAPAGRLATNLVLDIEQLGVPDIANENLRPKRIQLASHLSGVAIDAIPALADRIVDASPAERHAMLLAGLAQLFARTPLRAGIDRASVAIGQTTIEASGAVQVAGATSRAVSGGFDIRASHFDALIAAIATTDEATAAPALVLLQGLGARDGERTVWRVSIIDGKVTVNGQDVAAMLGDGPVRP